VPTPAPTDLDEYGYSDTDHCVRRSINGALSELGLVVDVQARPPERRTLDRRDQPRSSTLGTLRILEGTAHYRHAECPAELAPVVTSFLAEHVRA
jgi:hypothetical protein